MEVINIDLVHDFKEKHARARRTLELWLNKTECSTWRNLVELKQTFRSADYVKGRVIFNIGGNNYRLIAIVIYEVQKVIVKAVMTHAEYNRSKWL